MKINMRKVIPILLAVTGSIGVGATGYFAARAGAKAQKKLETAEKEKGEPLTATEKVKVAGVPFLPAIGVGVVTIGCVSGAVILGNRQAGMMVGAYGVLAKQFKDYKGKLVELYGPEADQKVKDALMVEKTEDIHITTGNGWVTSTTDYGDTAEPDIVRTFYDEFSERYFESTIAKVLEAEYHLNRNFALSGDIECNAFYEFLGLDIVEDFAPLGWTVSDEIYWIDFDHRITKLDDGEEIFVISMVFQPRAGYLED